VEAVPVIFATFPLVARIEKADMIFHLVFSIAFTFVVTQETAITLLTRVLKIEASPSKSTKSRLSLDPWETDKPMS
jgi:cell volume regulation protein A